MARVTVEDCLDYVENRFKLVLLASKRARQLSMGTEPLVEWENDKPTVVALREIEQGLVNEEMMQASMKQEMEEEQQYDEDDLAAALHAEISRELSQTTEETADTDNAKAQEPSPEQTTSSFQLAGFTTDSEQKTTTDAEPDAPANPFFGSTPNSPSTEGE